MDTGRSDGETVAVADLTAEGDGDGFIYPASPEVVSLGRNLMPAAVIRSE